MGQAIMTREKRLSWIAHKEAMIETFIQSVINHNTPSHSCENRNPEETWIPGQARNDNLHETCVVMYRKLRQEEGVTEW
jgi:hypothetical protein